MLRRVVLQVVLIPLGLSLVVAAVTAAEQSWEVRGEFVMLKAGEPATVVLRTADGVQVELPLAAFSQASQVAIARLSKSKPNGESKVIEVPPLLAADLAACRTAAACADVCRLALGGAELAGEARASVEAMLQEFDDRAERAEVRLGSEWVSPELAARAAEKATGHRTKAMEMIRLGNLKLAEQELRQASQADLASGRADFLLGLAFMMGTKADFDEAASSFEEAVRREPDNGAAWNNLGICNVQRRRYPAAVTAFRAASALLRDRQPVVSNLALVIRMATDRRSRISENQVDEVSSLYHDLLQAGGVAAPDAISGPVVLLVDGTPLTGGLGELRSLVATTGQAQLIANVAGIVVAPGVVAVSLPKEWLGGDAGLSVGLPDGRGLPATVAKKSPDGSLVLLTCEGLPISPLPMLPKTPAVGEALTIVMPANATTAVAGAVGSTGRATILASALATDRSRVVYELQPGGARDLATEQVPFLLDAAGRLAGVGLTQPLAQRSAPSRRLGLPVEVIWKLLGELDPSVTAAAAPGDAGKPVVDEIAARCRAAIVWIKPAGNAAPAP